MKQRQWRLTEFTKSGKFNEAQRLQEFIDKHPISKPLVNQIHPELDSRFIKVTWENETSFDGWITLNSLGNRTKIQIPIKKHKHFNNLLQRGGVLKNSVRLLKDSIVFFFDLPEVPKKTQGSVIGVDIGMTYPISTSEGLQVKSDLHNHTLPEIIKSLNKKKSGSKAFKKALVQRDNFIKWSVNQIDFSNVKELRRENIQKLRYKRKNTKYLNRFVTTVYSLALDKECEDAGVLSVLIDPQYTSQRCSKCVWVQKTNRKGSAFKCKSCDHTQDSDLNAALNISFNLSPLGDRWRSLNNGSGFYWLKIGQEFIVPDNQKTDKFL
jgi:transposase